MVLDPGDYVIVELLEDGWHQSYPSTPVLDPPFTPDEVRLGCFGYAITIADEPKTDPGLWQLRVGCFGREV